MGRQLSKWKNTGKYAWNETTSEYEFRVSPKFKTKKQAIDYSNKNPDLDKYFTVRDKETTDQCKADKLDPYGAFTEEMGGKPSKKQMLERGYTKEQLKEGVDKLLEKEKRQPSFISRISGGRF